LTLPPLYRSRGRRRRRRRRRKEKKEEEEEKEDQAARLADSLMSLLGAYTTCAYEKDYYT